MEPIEINKNNNIIFPTNNGGVGNKKKIIIVIPIVVLVILIGASLYYSNYSKKSAINISKKEDIIKYYFNGATTGKDVTGKDLTTEQRQALYKKSADLLVLYIQANPNDVEVLNNLAGAYYNTGQFDKAIEAYKNLITIDSSIALNYTNMAHCYMAIDQLELATENYQKSISLNPKIPINYINLAIISNKQGLSDKANQILSQGLLENPEDTILQSMKK